MHFYTPHVHVHMTSHSTYLYPMYTSSSSPIFVYITCQYPIIIYLNIYTTYAHTRSQFDCMIIIQCLVFCVHISNEHPKALLYMCIGICHAIIPYLLAHTLTQRHTPTPAISMCKHSHVQSPLIPHGCIKCP